MINSRDRVFYLLDKEKKRQAENIQMISSENFVSEDICSALSSVFTNKYAEGYPRRRVYAGCHFCDELEELCIERLCKLFSCSYANVQPHSGSQANQSVYNALLKPGDTILSMSLDCGGHLTHGSPVSSVSSFYNVVHYGVDRETCLIDYNSVEELAKRHKPNLIISGASSYTRQIDFKIFQEIARLCGAFLLADMAHISGIVAAGLHQNPVQYADVVTSTTHKTLRGPRGGFVLTQHEDIIKKINRSVFPGCQGGPAMNVIAAKAICFREALDPSFKAYISCVLKNISVISNALISCDKLSLVTGGTDNHHLVIDSFTHSSVYGSDFAQSLHECGIVCNKNSIPYDRNRYPLCSGIRIGTPAETTRGLDEKSCLLIAEVIIRIFNSIISGNFEEKKEEYRNMSEHVLSSYVS